jgi:hypothetical protein
MWRQKSPRAEMLVARGIGCHGNGFVAASNAESLYLSGKTTP